MPKLREKQTAIRDWLEGYHSSAGADVGVCMQVFDGLLEGPLNHSQALDELLEGGPCSWEFCKSWPFQKHRILDTVAY